MARAQALELGADLRLQPAICGMTDEVEVAPFWPAKVASTRATGPLHRSRALDSRPSGAAGER